MRAARKTAGIVAALAGALLATGCASSHGNTPGARTPTSVTDPRSSVPAWYAAGGTTLTTKLGADLAAIGADAASRDTAALKTHCADLATDTAAATSYPPIPDAQAQQHWAAALQSTAKGVHVRVIAIREDREIIEEEERVVHLAPNEVVRLLAKPTYGISAYFVKVTWRGPFGKRRHWIYHIV